MLKAGIQAGDCGPHCGTFLSTSWSHPCGAVMTGPPLVLQRLVFSMEKSRAPQVLGPAVVPTCTCSHHYTWKQQERPQATASCLLANCPACTGQHSTLGEEKGAYEITWFSSPQPTPILMMEEMRPRGERNLL